MRAKLTVLVVAVVLVLLTAGAQGQETREAACVPVEVSTSRSGVQVLCASDVLDGGESVRVFAVPANEEEFANRFLNMANAALVGGRGLNVRYQIRAWSLSEPPAPGCEIRGCRSTVAISVY